MSLRILFVISTLKPGGKERRASQLISGLAENEKYHCDLIVFHEDHHYSILSDSVQVTTLERNFRKDLSILVRFLKFAKKNKPDIIHCWDTISTLIAIPTSVLLRKKLITNKITDAPARYKKISYFGLLSSICFLFSNAIVANSKAGLTAYRIANLPKCHVIRNGFDFNRICDLKAIESIREIYGIKTRYIVGMVASFSASKDYNTFFSTIEILNHQRKDITFISVGDGLDFERYYQQYSEYPNIVFCGLVKDVESIINLFDIGVLSTYTEGISNSILEYMALGKPVIATEGGGTNEIIENSINGYLITKGDSDSLASKINTILDNKELKLAMGHRSREIVKSKFVLSQMIDQYTQLYQGMINGNCI